MKKPVSIVAVLALALSALAVLAATPAQAASVNLPLSCQGTLFGISQSQSQVTPIDVTAPAQVTAGDVFALTLKLGAVAVPSSAAGQTIENLTDQITSLALPAGTSFVSASLAGGSGLGSGTPTITAGSGKISLKIPGPMKGGTTVTPPVATVNLRATGAAGSTITTRLAGSSFGDPGVSFNVNISLGTVVTKCFASPNPTLATTKIVAPVPTLPAAPTIGAAVAGKNQATLSWTAPGDTGNVPLTGYVVTPYVGDTAQPDRTFASAGTTQIIVGLDAGTAYTFKVAAVNGVGTGPKSAASNAVTPSSLGSAPGAPTIGTATAASGTAQVAWTAPADDGGAPVVGYQITPSNGSGPLAPISFGSTATTQTVVGLTNGTTYTFKVAAINAVGVGAQSGASNAVTPVNGTSVWTPSGGCGSVQATSAPAGAVALAATAVGGPGGRSGSQASSGTVPGGAGGSASGSVPVAGGQAVTAVVGCAGQDGGGFSNSTAPAGFAPGGTSGRGSIIAGQAGASGGTGGGASAVCLGATCTAAGGSTPVVVGGGGGGGGVSNCSGTSSGAGGSGGAASATTGAGGAGPSGANGASAAGAGGAGGVNSSGGSASGGNAGNGSGGLGVNVVGGGGGGGRVGGAAGNGSSTGCTGGGGGGGGSSWAASTATGVTFGTGAAPSASVTFSIAPSPTVPGPAVAGTAIGGKGQAVVAWSPPAQTGGSAITGYVITPYAAGVAGTPVVVPPAPTSHTLTGLTNGTTYSFKVRATNGIGTGPSSLASNEVIPSWGFNAVERFVHAAYTDFLSRFPSLPELDDATVRLSGAYLTRAQFVGGLANSPEWSGAVVRQMYVDTLGRPGDAAGISYWSGQLLSGKRTVAQVAAAFYASAEYFNGIGTGKVNVWIADLYRKLLGRAADGPGLAYWAGETARTGRQAVALRFFESGESRRARVSRLYDKLLGRQPDAAGVAYWADRILTTGDIALAAKLASSGEYYARSQTRFP